MSWSDLGGLRLLAVLSWRDHRTAYPLRILVVSTAPRALLQVLFIAYLGQYAAGAEGRDFALIGASVHIATIATVIKGADMIIEDSQWGTLPRMRLAALPFMVIAATRWWIFVLEGIVTVLLAVTGAGLLLGRPALVTGMLSAAALVVLVCVSTTGLGLAAAAIALAGRSDVFFVNLVSYVMLAVTGVVAPLSRLPHPVATAAHLIPLTNGLLAIRCRLDGEPWLAHAAAEAAVGAGWFALAAVLFAVQQRRARRADTDNRW